MKQSSVVMRLFCLLLVLCMLCATFAACAGEEDDTKKKGTSEATKDDTPTEEALPTDEEGYLLNSIPETFKINDTFTILGWDNGNSGHKQHYREELSEDLVGNAIYTRSITIEEKLNVELEWNFVPGKWEEKTSFAQEIERTSSAGMAYDATVCYNLVPCLLAVQGLAENLYGTKYIDLTAPWWPSVYLDEALYNDIIYGLVESSSYSTLRQMTGVFFNNELIEKKGVKSPYDMVEANEWTLDNMMIALKDVYEDTNTDGKKDAADFYGVSTGNEAQIDSWFYGAGYRWSEFDGDGNLQLLAGEPSIIEFVDRMAVAFEQEDFFPVDKSHGKMFKEERALMYLACVSLAETTLKNMDIKYGIAPIPKGSQAQENYITHLSNTHDAWCIPLHARNIDNSSAVIESMAYESYRNVEPVYYDTCIKLRYAPDERLGAMYDLIREGITFDFFYLYGGTFKVFPITPMRQACQKKNSWTNAWASNRESWTTEFNAFVKLYTEKEN